MQCLGQCGQCCGGGVGLTRVWPGWGARLCCFACRPGVAPVARGDGPRSAWAPDDRPDEEETERADHVSMLSSRREPLIGQPCRVSPRGTFCPAVPQMPYTPVQVITKSCAFESSNGRSVVPRWAPRPRPRQSGGRTRTPATAAPAAPPHRRSPEYVSTRTKKGLRDEVLDEVP